MHKVEQVKQIYKSKMFVFNWIESVILILGISYGVPMNGTIVVATLLYNAF
jgi:hypothetical protein